MSAAHVLWDTSGGIFSALPAPKRLKGEAFWGSDSSGHNNNFALVLEKNFIYFLILIWIPEAKPAEDAKMFWARSGGDDGRGVGWARSRWDIQGLAEPLINTNPSRNTKFTPKFCKSLQIYRKTQFQKPTNHQGRLRGLPPEPSGRGKHILNFISHSDFKRFIFLFLISQAARQADEADTQLLHCEQPIME